jgi:1-deoxy-D-xylulose-5-phosphate reductoisomerase
MNSPAGTAAKAARAADAVGDDVGAVAVAAVMVVVTAAATAVAAAVAVVAAVAVPLPRPRRRPLRPQPVPPRSPGRCTAVAFVASRRARSPAAAAGTSDTMPETRRLIVLGSTGSIGTNTLATVEHLNRLARGRGEPDAFAVAGLAAGNNAGTLASQAIAFGCHDVALADAAKADGLRGSLPAGTRLELGSDAALALVDRIARKGDLVMAAMVGASGIPAVLAAIRRGCDIALANKETLVAAGSIVMDAVRAAGVRLLPVDSEHNAIFQCLRSGRSADEVRRLVLTASGGPFRTWDADRIANATVADALRHPTWTMGRKVTVDSASMMNKALELIEARWLFGMEPDRLEAIIHPSSVVHSFVEFVDGSVLAQLSPPDMRTPIQYALTYPDRVEGCSPRLDWSRLRSLEFEPVDPARFPAIGLAKRAISAGGTAGTVLNAANEIAVEAFLDGRIPFPRIAGVVAEALEAISPTAVRDLADVETADRTARTFARERLADVRAGAALPLGS